MKIKSRLGEATFGLGCVFANQDDDFRDKLGTTKSKRRITVWPFGSFSFSASFKKKWVEEPLTGFFIVVF